MQDYDKHAVLFIFLFHKWGGGVIIDVIILLNVPSYRDGMNKEFK